MRKLQKHSEGAIKRVKKAKKAQGIKRVKRKKVKLSQNPDDDKTVIVHEGKKKRVVKKRVKKIYKKQQCAFIGDIELPNGDTEYRQCRKKAVGKSTLCEAHGGNPVIKENLLPVEQEVLLSATSVKFNPASHPIDFINFSRHGASQVEIAAEFGISVQTLKGWAEKYASFNTAFEVGQAMHEAWWLTKGKDNLNSRNFNTPLYKFLTMNKLGYSDKVEQKSFNTTIHGVLVIPDKVTAEEWEQEAIDVN